MAVALAAAGFAVLWCGRGRQHSRLSNYTSTSRVTIKVPKHTEQSLWLAGKARPRLRVLTKKKTNIIRGQIQKEATKFPEAHPRRSLPDTHPRSGACAPLSTPLQLMRWHHTSERQATLRGGAPPPCPYSCTAAMPAPNHAGGRSMAQAPSIQPHTLIALATCPAS